MQNTKIIITGASGRMGATLVNLIQQAEDLELVAAIEREESLPKLAYLQNSTCKISSNTEEIFAQFDQQNVVVIDFTSPENTINTARLANTYKIAHIIGTTGLSKEEKEELEKLCQSNKIFFSANMSIGINVLLKFLPKLTQMLGSEYDVEMVELHHNKKKDSPSGTALRLAECLAEAKEWELKDVANYHREGLVGERPKEEIGIQTIRGGDVVGVHTVYYMGPGERIEITHQAHSRENFAQGALRAARWINTQECGKLYEIIDMFTDI